MQIYQIGGMFPYKIKPFRRAMALKILVEFKLWFHRVEGTPWRADLEMAGFLERTQTHEFLEEIR